MVSVTFEPVYLVKVVMGSQYMGMPAEASSPRNRLLSSALARVAGQALRVSLKQRTQCVSWPALSGVFCYLLTATDSDSGPSSASPGYPLCFSLCKESLAQAILRVPM